MSYPIRYRREISDDIAEAKRWYRKCGPGLEVEFVIELEMALNRIADNPRLFQIGDREIRIARLHRFPYMVCFRFTRETVVLVAIMHASRDFSIVTERLDSGE